MSADIQAAKEALRREIKVLGQNATPAERQTASAAIRNQLSICDFWNNASTILCFAALPDEPDILPLAKAAIAMGKTIALPRYNAVLQAYTAAKVEDFSKDCVQGKYGIVEPTAARPEVALNRLDLVLVPGVCFDLKGRRLGRGKGFYDRMLAQVAGLKCGLAFEWQVVDEVPAEPHDVRLNWILTPTRRASAASPAV